MDGYSIHRVIGEGSFGRALLVQSKINNEKYVLKEIRLPKTQSKLTDSRREAVLLSGMKHPNIVAFRESFEADGHLYIVMEYCSGGDLLHRIKEQKTTLLQEEDILKWFAHMCAGTMHIHDKRVLHRDLKSKNIFLTDNGTVKLGDFGSACVLNSSRAHAYTYVGTPYYVSPEIWDNKPYNNKSDVWSLGCVLYELCTLRHPFQARSWKSLILKVCRGAYAPLPSHLPYELHYLVKHMFKTDPRDRPSLHTILSSHRVARLLRRHLPSQAVDEEKETEKEEEGRTGRWRREEGEKVAMFLGQKSLLASSTCGASLREGYQRESGEEPRPRKQWIKGLSDTVLQALGNASLLSSDSVTTSTGQPNSVTGKGPVNSLGWRGKRERRRWSRSPPERLLSLLEKADLSTAFRTYSIHREGDHPLIGPLSHVAGGDDTDGGPEEEVELDEDRLEPRSDDEDTDFEDDSQSDWFDELEKLSLEH